VPNCYQVTTNLYRGAQPTAEGIKQLKAMGIKTVISLREFHSDKDMVEAAGLKSVRFKMSPMQADENEVVAFLKAATDTNNLPVFVHCERGADRTGTMCAMYRITVCGWTKEQAIEEMKNGGFDFSPVWQNLVEFIEKADVPNIRRRAGLDGK
jgi:protein tyrosine/serine phosphatase